MKGLSGPLVSVKSRPGIEAMLPWRLCLLEVGAMIRLVVPAFRPVAAGILGTAGTSTPIETDGSFEEEAGVGRVGSIFCPAKGLSATAGGLVIGVSVCILEAGAGFRAAVPAP
jgi:hypothetical protein